MGEHGIPIAAIRLAVPYAKPRPRRNLDKKRRNTQKTKAFALAPAPRLSGGGNGKTRLRRQFGRTRRSSSKISAMRKFFRSSASTNPQSSGNYRLAIRGRATGGEFLFLPDFATKRSGHLQTQSSSSSAGLKGSAAASRHWPGISAAVQRRSYLRYGAERRVQFRPGSACPPALAKRAASLFRRITRWRSADSPFPEARGVPGELHNKVAMSCGAMRTRFASLRRCAMRSTAGRSSTRRTHKARRARRFGNF